MNRQVQSPFASCCHCRNENILKPVSRNTNCKEFFPERQNDYLKNNASRRERYYRNNDLYDTDFEFDDESWHALSSLRQRACQLARSDTDYTTSTDTHCGPEKQYKCSSLLRRANDLIDYAPQSEFLRKMKQQCEYLQNCRPNIFSTLDELLSDCPSYECQKCAEICNPVYRFREEDKNRILKSSIGTQYEYDGDPQLFENQMLSRNSSTPGTRSKKSQVKKQPEENKSKNERKKVIERKSEHISRSRKQVRCRGRRKRKSTSSEKCESENEFEPSLKKPHENSCERCWRYASPARSPVNKPDQRYDPNFRRGHSCIDLENVDGEPEIYRAEPCRNLEPVTGKDREQVPPSLTQRFRVGRHLEPHAQRPLGERNLESHTQRPQTGRNWEMSPQRPLTGRNWEISIQRPQTVNNREPSFQRYQNESRLEQPLQKPRSNSNLEPLSQRSQNYRHLEQPPQRSQFGSRLSSIPKQKTPSAQLTPLPIITQQPSAPFPTSSYSFTEVKEYIPEPLTQVELDKCISRAPTFENSEENKTELPASAENFYSESGRRPRPKSYTQGMSVDDSGIMSRDIGESNFKDCEDKSAPRRHYFDSPVLNAKTLKSPSAYAVSPNTGENFLDGFRSSSPRSSHRPSSPRGSFRPSSPRGSFRPFSPHSSPKPSSPRGSFRPSSPRGSLRPSSPRGSLRPSSPRGSLRPSSPRGSLRPSSPRSSFRPSDQSRSQQTSGKKTEPPKESKSISPKADLSVARAKTPKVLIKTPPKAASASAKVSPTKDSKSLKSSPSKRPATGIPKKGNSRSASPKVYISEREVEKSPKRSSQKQNSPKPSPNKTKSQQAVPKKAPAADKKKPQSADPTVNRHETSENESIIRPFVTSPHPLRECRCYPRLVRPGDSSEDQSDHIFCCHCDWDKNENLASDERYSHNNPSDVQPKNELEQANETDNTIYADIQIESNGKNQPTFRSCQCRRNPPKSAPPENFKGEVLEKTLRCPYRHYMNLIDSSSLKTPNTAENGRSVSWENEQQLPRERKNGPANLEPNGKEFSPRKYFVFYATKSKENRGKNDVEVLVEELASCQDAKDSRTKDITEKMRKILECPSDSMALRFQKGVSEMCRTPRSSRILYF